MNKLAYRIGTSLIAATLSVTAYAGEKAEPITKLNAFYFGNSYLGNTMPGFHTILGKTAGKEWHLEAAIRPGVPIWVHMKSLMDKDATHAKFVKAAPQTDALVMLMYGGHGLSYVSKGTWGITFPESTDIGDLNACTYVINEYLKYNPNGRVYIYTAWPGIPGMADVKKRVQEETEATLKAGENVPSDEILMKVKERKLNDEEMAPFRQGFDYAKEWLTQDYIAESAPTERRERFSKYVKALNVNPKTEQSGPKTFAELAKAVGIEEKIVREDLAAIRVTEADLAKPQPINPQFIHAWANSHSRAHMWAIMEGLKKQFPKLWEGGRLGMIPVGDVFLEIDKKMRAGKVPGLTNIGEYSVDGGHLRCGLGRYTLAATFYAVLFKDDPNHLDPAIYAKRENYINPNSKINTLNGFYCHIPDLGSIVEITPERAKAVNDTIWEVVNSHPYTQMK